jgi:hypothetical protein
LAKRGIRIPLPAAPVTFNDLRPGGMLHVEHTNDEYHILSSALSIN